QADLVVPGRRGQTGRDSRNRQRRRSRHLVRLATLAGRVDRRHLVVVWRAVGQSGVGKRGAGDTVLVHRRRCGAGGGVRVVRSGPGGWVPGRGPLGGGGGRRRPGRGAGVAQPVRGREAGVAVVAVAAVIEPKTRVPGRERIVHRLPDHHAVLVSRDHI